MRTNLSIERFTLTLAFCLLSSQIASAQLTVEGIQRLKESRMHQLQLQLPKSRGDAQATVALATIFSEAAISQNAKDSGIEVSDSQVEEFLFPLLAKQGLVRLDQHLRIREDSNVNKWLKGQNWTMDQLFNSGKILLLWTELVAKSTTCTDQDVKNFVAKHPEVYLFRERLQLNLTQFENPQQINSKARGIAEAEVVAPQLSLTARSAIDSEPISAIASPEWGGLKLYVELDRLDPKLRTDLAGKKAGDEFGPIRLSDGTIIAGSLAAVLPGVDLSGSPEFWKYAVLLTKLDKANQKEQFDQIAKSYLSGIQDKAVRGLFGDILGTVGTGIGAVFGDGFGAPVGALIGGSVGGWIDGQINTPSTPSGAPMAPQGPPPGFSPVFGPSPFAMPNVFQRSYPQMPQMSYVPPMPQYYQPYFPPPIQMWGPPIFMPMPVYY